MLAREEFSKIVFDQSDSVEQFKNYIVRLQTFINQNGSDLSPTQKMTVYQIALAWNASRPAPKYGFCNQQVTHTHDRERGGAEFNFDTPFHRAWLGYGRRRVVI